MSREPLQTDAGVTRREFLAFSGWLALGATTLGAPLTAQAARFNRELVQVTDGRLAMGTFVNMVVFHPSKDQAEQAMGKAFTEMNRLIGVFNCHDGSTPVGYLNKTGSLRDVSPELYHVLTSALEFNGSTAGAFDITVKPVLDLYEQSFATRQGPPEREQITEALQVVGSNRLKVRRDGVSFLQERMSITLDGIAKGYIVDRTMSVLRSNGIKHALINAGGDICVTGPRGDGKPWNVGIQDPWHTDETIEVVELTHGAVATSGSYEVYFDREKVYHHIISPRAGLPVSGPVSVSAVAADAVTADALSTSVFVMGVGKGRAFLEKTSNVAGLIVSSDQRRHYASWPTKV